MALYLSMDGVDDRLYANNSVAYNKVVLDVDIATQDDTATRYLVDSLSRSTGGYMRITSGSWANNMSATGLALNTRTTITGTVGTPYTGGVSFFGAYGNLSFLKGKVYNIKIYNGTTLVGHYDMTTGTVQDQSGNGNHATLTGGTWLDDGGGGTGASINAVTATSNADTIAPVVTTQQQVTVSSIIADTIAEAFAPTISTEVSIDVLIASSTADALSPNVGSFTNISVSAIIASATADVIAPSVYTSQGIQIDSVIADLSADAISPTIQTDAIITAIISELQAAGIADTLRVIIGDLAQYNEVIRIVLNISRNQTSDISITRSKAATLEVTQHKQSDLNL